MVRPLARALLVLTLLVVAGCGGGGSDGTAPRDSTPTGVPRGGYVALGDSFASGTGTSRIYGDRCQRSRRAYPWLLAEERGERGRFIDAACAGTTTTQVLGSQLGFLTGDTRLITLTTGGNDIGALAFVGQCLTLTDRECRIAGISVREAIRKQLPARLDALFDSIRVQSPEARTILVGYPRLFAGRACRKARGLSVGEQRRVNRMTDELNMVLAARAREADVAFADPRSRFAGHGVCSTDSWINAPETGAAALHPNDRGHRLGMLPTVQAAVDG